MTVYASIGNSDDKLTQAEWCAFTLSFVNTIKLLAERILGEWYSAPKSPWQNACVGFIVSEQNAPFLKSKLADLAPRYRQDSIAWAEVSTTLFLCTA